MKTARPKRNLATVRIVFPSPFASVESLTFLVLCRMLSMLATGAHRQTHLSQLLFALTGDSLKSANAAKAQQSLVYCSRPGERSSGRARGRPERAEGLECTP